MDNILNVIKRRTSKILGGYYTEYLFLKNFKNMYRFSKNWWFCYDSNNDEFRYFLNSNSKNDIDREFEKILNKNNIKNNQVVYLNGEFKILCRNNIYSINEFVELNNLTPIEKQKQVRKHDDYLVDRCIKEFDNLGILNDIGSSILLEDSFLNKYFYTSNIDALGIDTSGTVRCYEIKFKDEFTKDIGGKKRLVFGFDKFQMDKIYRNLNMLNVPTSNIVLYNYLHVKGDTDKTNIFSFMDELNRLKIDELVWMEYDIDFDKKYAIHKVGNKDTSWNGLRERDVYCLELDNFINFPPNNKNSSWGPCFKGGGRKMLRINGKTQEQFMGCTCYKNH